MEYLPRDEPFQATEDLFVAEPLTSAPLCVGPCGLVVIQRNDSNTVQGRIDSAVASTVEPMATRIPGTGWQRAGAPERRK